MGNDLNTASALTVLYDVLKSNINSGTKRYLIHEFDRVLSLNLIKEQKPPQIEIDTVLREYADQKIKERNEAKIKKDFLKADEIRDELKAKGIQIKDTREGTIWSYIDNK